MWNTVCVREGGREGQSMGEDVCCTSVLCERMCMYVGVNISCVRGCMCVREEVTVCVCVWAREALCVWGRGGGGMWCVNVFVYSHVLLSKEHSLFANIM